MNPQAEFLSIQLENSILCKHRKIAGRVETIFCEAAPIRLNEICRLKRIGPEPTAFDRCPECRQYVCNCLWKKNIHLQPNERLYSGNCNAMGVSKVKSRPKVNTMPFKVRKWNSNYGNTFSTQMSWLKKPVHKMSFSDDDFDDSFKSEEHKPRQNNNTMKSAIESKPPSAFPIINCHLQKSGKVDNNESGQLRKDYFEKRRKALPDEKSIQSNLKSVKKSKIISSTPKTAKQSHMLEKQPIAKSMRDVKKYSTPKQDLSMHFNTMLSVAPKQVPPRSPVAPQLSADVRHEAKMSSYVHRVTELLHSRSMFGSQAQRSSNCPSMANSQRMNNHLTKMSDAFNYPSRFNLMKPDEKDCRRKASDFLLKYKENGVSKPACTIESLENIENKVRKTLTKPNIKTVERNAFYGDRKKFEQQTIHKGIDYSMTNRSHKTHRNTYDRGEKKIMKNIAVQTEESSFFIPTLIQAQQRKKIDFLASNGDVDDEYEKIISLKAIAVESSLLRMEQDFGEALVQELVCELADEVAKCNSRVKKLAALFESRSKINSRIQSRSQSLCLLNIRHSDTDVNLNRENAKSFCSATEFSSKIKNQKQKQKEATKKDDAVSKDVGYDSSSSSKSYSGVSITTVVSNPLKKDKHNVISRGMEVSEAK